MLTDLEALQLIARMRLSQKWGDQGLCRLEERRRLEQQVDQYLEDRNVTAQGLAPVTPPSAKETGAGAFDGEGMR